MHLRRVDVARQKVGDVGRDGERAAQDGGTVEPAHHRAHVEALRRRVPATRWDGGGGQG